MSKPLIKLSATAIDTFLSCRKKYYYSRILNIQPTDRPDALDFGSAVHKALAYIFNELKTNPSNGIKEVLPNAIDQIKQYAEEYCLPKESECKAIALISSYVNLYWFDDRLKYEVLDVEKYFERPLDISQTTLVCTHGYFDAIVKDRQTEKVYVVEHKTTGMFSDDYVEHSIFDTQVMIYMDACKNIYGRCDGVIYDVLSKPKHSMSVGETDDEFESRKAASKTGRIKRKESETPEQFIQRIQESFNESTLTRHLIEHTNEELEAFGCELRGIYSDMHYCNSYYKCTGNCLKYGACPYMNLCSGKVTLDNLGDKFVRIDSIPRED